MVKKTNPDLEKCITRLETEDRNKSLQSIEIYAVNTLIEKTDILKFYNKYVQCMKKEIAQKVQENAQNHAVHLVQKGYSIQKVAAFFVHYGLMYTLGHIHNQEKLKAWYSTLPYMTKSFAKEMYAS